jgi:acyl-CoA synthetase (AMP-forming)/AMP-acid ligase II
VIEIRILGPGDEEDGPIQGNVITLGAADSLQLAENFLQTLPRLTVPLLRLDRLLYDSRNPAAAFRGPIVQEGSLQAEELLDRGTRHRPAGEAIFCGATVLSYPDVRRRVHRLTAALARLGAGPGDRIAILHRNCHRFFESYFAALHLGAVLVPLNPRLSAGEMKAVLECAEPILIVSEPSTFLALAPVLKRLAGLRGILWTGALPPFEDPLFRFYEEEIALSGEGEVPAPRLDDSSPAQIYFTSGSTGVPKGVVLTRRNILEHASLAMADLGIDQDTAWGHIAPMFHLADAWAVWAVTAAGGTHAFLPEFSAGGALALLESGRVSATNLVPTMVHRMLREPALESRQFPSLKLLMSGGAPMPSETVLRILPAFRCEYIQTYGLTETSPFLTLSRPEPFMKDWPLSEQLRIRCTTGRPLCGVEVRVVAEDGAEVPRDGKTVGEIQARGPTVTPGYWKDPLATAAAFEEGWLKTGDLAVVGPEGYLTIVDRKKDLIITGGEKVYSLEVENALAMHPEVVESAVLGLPDPDLGEAVVAVVVARQPRRVTPQDLVRHCEAHLTYFKVPKQVQLVDELPRTASGKVLKRELRERLGRALKAKVAADP